MAVHLEVPIGSTHSQIGTYNTWGVSFKGDLSPGPTSPYLKIHIHIYQVGDLPLKMLHPHFPHLMFFAQLFHPGSLGSSLRWLRTPPMQTDITPWRLHAAGPNRAKRNQTAFDERSFFGGDVSLKARKAFVLCL